MFTSAFLLAMAAYLQAPAAASEWKEYTAGDGGYAVELPGEPDERSQPASTPKGSENVRALVLTHDRTFYSVHATPVPKLSVQAREKYFDALRDGRKFHGRIFGEKKLNTGGLIGREFSVETAANGNEPAGLHQLRILLVKDRVYQLMAVTPKALAETKAADVRRFFDSFRPLGDGRPAGSPRAGGLPGAPPARGPAVVPPPDLPEDWVAFRSGEGGFTVSLPEAPKETRQTIETGAGPSGIATYSANGKGLAFVITYSDTNAAGANNPNILFDGTREVVLANSKARLLRGERKITVGRYNGREFQAEMPIGEDFRGGLLKCRLVLVGRRLYQVMAIYPREQASREEIAMFFRSFKILSSR